jgi:hypothetical protein
MTWYMRMGTGVELLGLAASGVASEPDAGGAPIQTNASVESETARAESALASEVVREVVMAGTVGGGSNRPATGP